MAPVTIREQRARLSLLIDSLPADAIDEVVTFVEYLQYKAAPKPPARKKKKVEFAAFGMWKDRTDITDSAKYSLELRRNMMKRVHDDQSG